MIGSHRDPFPNPQPAAVFGAQHSAWARRIVLLAQVHLAARQNILIMPQLVRNVLLHDCNFFLMLLCSIPQKIGQTGKWKYITLKQQQENRLL